MEPKFASGIPGWMGCTIQAADGRPGVWVTWIWKESGVLPRVPETIVRVQIFPDPLRMSEPMTLPAPTFPLSWLIVVGLPPPSGAAQYHARYATAPLLTTWLVPNWMIVSPDPMATDSSTAVWLDEDCTVGTVQKPLTSSTLCANEL